MSELWDELGRSALFADVSPVELVGVVFAVIYLLLAIRQHVLCWPAALVSVVLSFALFLETQLYSQAALQVFYFAMGVYGWHEWTRGGADRTGVEIVWWPLQRHLAVLAAIAVAGTVLGWLLSRTDAAAPYVDSLVSVAAVVTTYMVAKKVMENWIYWFVIDAVTLYLCASRGLVLYAWLYALYLVLVVIGLRAWLRDFRAQPQATLQSAGPGA